MRRMPVGVIALLLLLVSLIVSMTVAAGATAPQLWYLDSEITMAGFEMEKLGGSGDDGQMGSVDIGAGDSVVWLADQAAMGNVTFAGGAWVVELKFDSEAVDEVEKSTGFADACIWNIGKNTAKANRDEQKRFKAFFDSKPDQAQPDENHNKVGPAAGGQKACQSGFVPKSSKRFDHVHGKGSPFFRR